MTPNYPVLQQLEQAGSDLTKLHPAEFFLYFPTEDAARQAAERIASMGYETIVDFAADGFAWLCLAKRTLVPSLEALIQIRRDFEAIAIELGGEYDGWGTPVVK